MRRCDRRTNRRCVRPGLAFRSEPVAYDRRNFDEQRALLTRHFRRRRAGSATRCLRRAAATAEDFYFDTFRVRHVRASTHADDLAGPGSRSPGDAGYCASTAERHGHQPRARRRICVWQANSGRRESL